MIVAAVWLDNVLCMGVLKTGGIFQPVLQDYFNDGAGTIAWISSISLSMRATAGRLHVLKKKAVLNVYLVVVF